MINASSGFAVWYFATKTISNISKIKAAIAIAIKQLVFPFNTRSFLSFYHAFIRHDITDSFLISMINTFVPAQLSVLGGCKNKLDD